MAAKKSNKNLQKQTKQTETVPSEGKFSLPKIKEFLSGVKKGFFKIVWPEKDMTIRTTLVVIVLVILVSFYLGAVDLILGKLITGILS